MPAKRSVLESPFPQGQDERRAYFVNTAPWGGGAPTAVVVKIYDVSPPGTLVDKSADNLSGAASVTDLVITTPLVIALVPEHKYRLEIKWTHQGNTDETFAIIDAEL